MEDMKNFGRYREGGKKKTIEEKQIECEVPRLRSSQYKGFVPPNGGDEG